MSSSNANNELLTKEEHLKQALESYGSIAVAYSGGVDSTYLADVAHELLRNKAHMLIADSPSVPRAELAEAKGLARQRGWRLDVIVTAEFTLDAYLRNDPQRCYVCKSELFGRMRQYAEQHSLAAVAHGETLDDAADRTRVGARAAEELGVVAPLREAGLCKEDIRRLSRFRDLPTWDKPSFACLASRFPVGTRLSLDAVARVEQAENVLKREGFRQYRARHHGPICRVELDPGELAKALAPGVRERIVRDITAAGYRYVTLDLAGYRTGSTAALPESKAP